jgi:acetyl-CoA carboxylase carboxyltransferase component
MARLMMDPIGEPAETESTAFQRNRAHTQALEERIQGIRDEVRQGWGPKYVERCHEKGKLTTWERIDRLADEGTIVRPVGTMVNYGEDFGGRTSPAAGVITAFVTICGRHTVVIANDNTVASGSWWPRTPEKIQRAQEIALRLRVPVVYLVDCSGLFLPQQGLSFPGKRGAGHIFKMNSLLSASGVPQIAGVFGDCIAGGGYMPIISDKVIMTEKAYMVIAGAALIKGAKGKHITSVGIGGADVHVHLSGCADERVPDDETCLRVIRRELDNLPTSAVPYYRYGVEPAPPAFATTELAGVFPENHAHRYPVREVIARLIDSSIFWEFHPSCGQEIVCGVGRISGLYVGIVANNQDLVPHPDEPDRKRAGGILYREGIAKVSTFSRACNDDGIPLVWLQDISGFDIGEEAERQGLLGYGSSLIYTNSTNTVPMITVLLRKASGAGYYAMAGHPYDPVLQLSTPMTRLAVMEGRTLAIGAFNAKLDDDFQISSQDPGERAKVKTGMAAVEAQIEADMDPVASARQMDTDEIVFVSEIRGYLETAVEMSYQTYGVRRVKNPRIWSLHDLEVMTP